MRTPRSTPIHVAAALLIALASMLGGCAAASAPTSAPAPLRIMTYNIRHGEGMDGITDLHRIAAVIVDAKPEAVALQEVDLKTGRTGRVDQAAALAALTGLEHHAFGRFMDYDGGQYGMAILSRYPIASSRVIDLPPGRHEPRTALLASIDRPDAPFVLVGVHFDWLDDDGPRFAQGRALVAAIAEDARPIVITGDFNDVPGSRTIEYLDRAWTRIPKVPGAAFTFPSPQPEREIDMVYARASRDDPQNEPTGVVQVIDERVASDHRPAIATITW